MAYCGSPRRLPYEGSDAYCRVALIVDTDTPELVAPLASRLNGESIATVVSSLRRVDKGMVQARARIVIPAC